MSSRTGKEKKNSKAKPKKWNKQHNKNQPKKPGRRSSQIQKTHDDRQDAISMETMTDRRFNRVFTDPTFQAIPNKKRDTDKIQVDSRFESMFSDPSFRTGYRIDKYGREVTNNEAYDLHKFYQLDDNQQQAEEDDDAAKTQTEGYDAEEEEEEDDADDDDITPKQAPHTMERTTLNKAMQKRVAKFKQDANAEIDKDDAFWGEWKEEDKGGNDEEDGEEEEEEETSNNKKKNKLGLSAKDEKLLNRRAGAMFAYAADSSSSSSDGSDYDYERLDADEVGEDVRAILDETGQEQADEAVKDCKPTKRIAVVNCDWDNLSAKDLFMIFRSFVPPEGTLQRVAIHPSEYGIKMMQKEDRFGPDPDIWQKNELATEVKLMEAEANFIDANEEKEGEEQEEYGDGAEDEDGDVDELAFMDDDDDDEEEDENEAEEEEDETTQQLHQEMSKLEQLENTIDAIKHGRVGDVLEDEHDMVVNKQALRKYELQKLRYYYAIVEFDGVATADRVYQELDGREYRHTCNVLNLSFVPAEFETPFEPTDVCAEIPEQYTAASDRHCNALGSTFVDLSWDKTDPNRIESCQRAFSEQKLNDMDLDAYLQDDDGITDAGFDTDYPVTEYDTDTPDKKVLIKRRARNRYKDILEEFRTMEKNIRGSDDEEGEDADGGTDGAITDDGDERYDNVFRINVGRKHKVEDESGDESDEDEDEDGEDGDGDDLGDNGEDGADEREKRDLYELDKGIKAFKDRLQRKRAQALEQASHAQLNVENISSSSSEEDDDVAATKDAHDDDDGVNGDKEVAFDLDAEVSNLNDWIDTQKRLKQNIRDAAQTQQGDTNTKKRRLEDDDDEEEEEDEDDEPLVQMDDMDADEMNDPFFKGVHDSSYMDAARPPPKKKQKLSASAAAENDEQQKKQQLEQRALLEMVMAGDDTNKYDPENTELDTEELAKKFNKRLGRNWRLRRSIKKAVKKKLSEMDAFEFDADDDRFQALTQDPDFAMDPTSTQFRNSKVMKQLLQKTRTQRLKKWAQTNKQKWHRDLKRKSEKESVASVDASKLIESVKQKSSQIPSLQNTQKHRKDITQSLKQKGLASFNK